MTSLAILSTISEKFGETPEHLVNSLVKLNDARVKEVHLVYPGYSGAPFANTDKLPGFKIHSSVDAIRFGADVAMVVEVPPTCELTLGALDRAVSALERGSEQQTIVGVSSSFVDAGFSPLYGFLIVLSVIDWIWNVFLELGKLTQHTDVRARYLLRKGTGRCVLPPYKRFSWRVWNPEVMRGEYGGDVARSRRWNTATPGDYVAWVLHTHEHLGFGLWWFPALILWFSRLVIHFVFLYGQHWTMYGFNASLVSAEIMLAFFIGKNYVRVPYFLLWCALTPIYVMAFPFMVFFSKIIK